MGIEDQIARLREKLNGRAREDRREASWIFVEVVGQAAHGPPIARRGDENRLRIVRKAQISRLIPPRHN
jgi:hypothetical protein